MAELVEGLFTSNNLSCPVCGLSIVPPVLKYCEHISIYCVSGPVDDLHVEYLVEGFALHLNDISSEKKLLKIAGKHDLSIYKFTEQDAYYPTIIFLGIKRKQSAKEGK